MTLAALVAIVFVANLVTFGNGPVMVPILQEELVEGRGVLTLDELLYAFAVARATPGQANTYVAAVGWFLFGLGGAIATTAAIVLPGYLMIPFLRAYERFRGHGAVAAFISGVTAASVGLIFAATIAMGEGALGGAVSWVVFSVALVLLVVARLPGVAALFVAGTVGLVLHAAGVG